MNTICTNCGLEFRAGAYGCPKCELPAGEDVAHWFECDYCHRWHRIGEMIEWQGGVYSRACLEQMEAERAEAEEMARTCPTCGGSGGGFKPFQCRTCHGTGQVKTEDDREREAVAAEMKADEMREAREAGR
jgi:RecJ-like exonuclease